MTFSPDKRSGQGVSGVGQIWSSLDDNEILLTLSWGAFYLSLNWLSFFSRTSSLWNDLPAFRFATSFVI